MDEELFEKLWELKGQNILVGGAWILSFATLVTALGETRLLFLQERETDEESQGKLQNEAEAEEDGQGEGEEREEEAETAAEQAVVVGQTLEAFGNAVQAVGRTKIYEASPSVPKKLGVLGCWIQAAGNTGNAIAEEMVVAGMEVEGERNNAISSGIQSFGAILEAAGAAGVEPTPAQGLEVYGNIVIAYGAALDSIGGIFALQGSEYEGQLIEFAGSWIQFIGAIMELIAVTDTLAYLESEISKGDEQLPASSERYSSYSKYNGSR